MRPVLWGIGEGDCLELNERGIRPIDESAGSHQVLDELERKLAAEGKDIVFNRALATRGIIKKKQLLLLLDATSLDQAVRGRIRDHIERDFR